LTTCTTTTIPEELKIPAREDIIDCPQPRTLVAKAPLKNPNEKKSQIQQSDKMLRMHRRRSVDLHKISDYFDAGKMKVRDPILKYGGVTEAPNPPKDKRHIRGGLDGVYDRKANTLTSRRWKANHYRS